MKKYKISSYRSGFTGLIIKQLNVLAIPIGLVVILIIFVSANSSTVVISGAAVFIILALAFLIFIVAYYPLSYTLTLTDDRRLIEKQWFNPSREIRIDQITEANWGYLGTAPHGPIGMLLRRFRGKITSSLAKTPDRIGLQDWFSYGVQLSNPKFKSFPKYPVSVDFIQDLKQERPDLVIQGLPHDLGEVLRRRRFTPSFVLYVVGALAIFIGLTLDFNFLFLISGIVMLFFGKFVSKQQ